MMTYEIEVSGVMPYDPKTRLTINARSLDTLRKRIIKEFLTPRNVVSVWKVRKDMSTEYLGCVTVMASIVWMTDDHGKRTIRHIDPKTGKLTGGYRTCPEKTSPSRSTVPASPTPRRATSTTTPPS